MHYWSHFQSIWSSILIILHLRTPKTTSSNSHLQPEMTENPKQTRKQVKRVHNLVSWRDYSSQERKKKLNYRPTCKGITLRQWLSSHCYIVTWVVSTHWFNKTEFDLTQHVLWLHLTVVMLSYCQKSDRHMNTWQNTQDRLKMYLFYVLPISK